MSEVNNNKPLPDRIDKTLNWLETSRDSWKNKAKHAKEELKKKTLAVKRARESREENKRLFEKQEKAFLNSLEEKNIEIIKLQKQLAEAQVQMEELKKKHSHL